MTATDRQNAALPEGIRSTPWDKRALGMETFELAEVNAATLEFSERVAGHYTAKVDPLDATAGLHRSGFYYCDTLLQPFADRKMFSPRHDARIHVGTVTLDELLPMCRGVFAHGRFHRDPNVDNARADQRYINWLGDLFEGGRVFGLYCDGALAAFFACQDEKVLLHAVAEAFRGKGLAKFLWSAGCEEMFSQGYRELTSSVSAANLAVVNLYASLGFRFRAPLDVYHKVTP